MQIVSRTNLDVHLDGVDAKIYKLLRGALSVFLSLVLIFSFYLISSNSFWVRFLPAVTNDLVPIAEIKSVEGTVLRKTTLDTLWIPISKNSKVFDSDLISTGDGDRAEVEMGDISFSIDPNSLVRMKVVDGKALIRLSSGSLNAKSKSDQMLKIQRGSQVEDVKLETGTYAIKSDSAFGVQITGFNQGVDEKKSAKNSGQPDPEKDTTKEDLDEATDDAPTPENLADNKNEKKSSQPFDASGGMPAPKEPIYNLPTPKENTQFLFRTPHSIVIAAQSLCTGICQLKIFRNQTEWRTIEFKEGQNPAFTLEASDLLEGRYDWLYKANSLELRSHFAVDSYADDKFIRAMEAGRPVEVF